MLYAGSRSGSALLRPILGDDGSLADAEILQQMMNGRQQEHARLDRGHCCWCLLRLGESETDIAAGARPRFGDSSLEFGCRRQQSCRRFDERS